MLLRHGKAKKNIANIHGGDGSGLVSEGIDELNEVSFIIEESNIKFTKILYSSRVQCYETAILLSDKLKISLSEILDLIPINLGVLDGLSEKEAYEKYPIYAKCMDEWRHGRIEINQLKIPGISDFNTFFESGKRFLDSLNPNDSYIIIATRSNLVLLANIMLGHNPQIGGGYKEITWRNAGYITFEEEYGCYSPTSLTNIL